MCEIFDVSIMIKQENLHKHFARNSKNISFCRVFDVIMEFGLFHAERPR